MTSYTDKGPKPEFGRFLNFHHLTFYVGNAKQAASYFITRMGFQPFVYKGLETGNRTYAAHAVKQNKIVFLFVSPYEESVQEMNEHICKHGDGVKDVSFEVEDLENILLVIFNIINFLLLVNDVFTRLQSKEEQKSCEIYGKNRISMVL